MWGAGEGGRLEEDTQESAQVRFSETVTQSKKQVLAEKG